MSSEHDLAVHTSHRFTVPEMEALFHEIGLEPVLSTYRLFFLFPAMAVSRMLHKPRARAGQEVRSDLQRPPGPIVNGLLASVGRFENRLIARGVSLPFGGSVFVLGRKPRG